MIEVVYNGETKQPDMPAETSQSTLKNIRQIGNISGNTKIYVEDCTMVFLEQQLRKQEPPVIALLGKEIKEEMSVSMFVNGAVVAEKITVKGNMLDFAADAFTELYDEAAAYFPKSVILGWFLPAYEMIDMYAGLLGEYSRLFLLEEPTEQEELFYIRDEKRLIKQGGYYIYYQNNEQMKHYMRQLKEAETDRRQQVQKEDEPQLHAEGWTDLRKRTFAAGEGEVKNVRTIPDRRRSEKERFDAKNTEKAKFTDDYEQEAEAFSDEQPKLTVFLYGVSTVLAIVVLVIGITMVSNYERMYEMQETIETIAGSIVSSQDGAEGQSRENEAQTDSPQGEAETDSVLQEGTEQQNNGQDSGINESKVSGDAGEADMQGDTQTGQSGQADSAATANAETPVIYTVQEGDTLTSISRKFYLSEDYVNKIMEANEDLKQNELTVGQKIVLP